MKCYAVYYSYFAEGVEQRELQEVYLTEDKAQQHNTMTKTELAWSGITSVDIETIEVVE